MKLFEVECSDRSGEHTYEVKLVHEFGRFSSDFRSPSAIKRKAMELYIESSQHEVLFSDYTRGDPGTFLTVFFDQRGVWLEVIRQTDDKIIGSMYLTGVIPNFDADAHFTFWDSIARGREEIVLEAMGFAFARYSLRRITTNIPVYQSGVLRFAKRLGFVEEGKRREAIIHKGKWLDLIQLGMLQEEYDGRSTSTISDGSRGSSNRGTVGEQLRAEEHLDDSEGSSRSLAASGTGS